MDSWDVTTSSQPAGGAGGRPGGGPPAGTTQATGGHETHGTRTIGVAIPIPDPYGRELQRVRESFGDRLASGIPTHITLLPPSQIDAAELGAIERHLAQVARTERPFRIRLHGTGTFRPVSPVVFVALAEGTDGCARLHAKVLAGPPGQRPQFPYHPHVTVAHHLSDEQMDRAYKEMADYEAAFQVWGFSLYEHGADGVWRPRRDFLFGTGTVTDPPERGA
ncbi:2'-5' RNA ligase family protein [Actinomadura keratinilytica]|uniref:2'-5' RNA ligase family protein n=1 Tax=Actinomadura keratinilytica TaxID=547461 RepID=A0ABP7ZCC1_9ACTN